MVAGVERKTFNVPVKCGGKIFWMRLKTRMSGFGVFEEIRK